MPMLPAEGIPDQARGGHGRVLAGAAAGGRDRPAIAGGAAYPLHEPCDGLVPCSPLHQASCQRRLGGDHLGHQVRWPGAPGRRGRRDPRVGRTRERGVRVEVRCPGSGRGYSGASSIGMRIPRSRATSMARS